MFIFEFQNRPSYEEPPHKQTKGNGTDANKKQISKRKYQIIRCCMHCKILCIVSQKFYVIFICIFSKINITNHLFFSLWDLIKSSKLSFPLVDTHLSLIQSNHLILANSESSFYPKNAMLGICIHLT